MLDVMDAQACNAIVERVVKVGPCQPEILNFFMPGGRALTLASATTFPSRGR